MEDISEKMYHHFWDLAVQQFLLRVLKEVISQIHIMVFLKLHGWVFDNFCCGAPVLPRLHLELRKHK